MYFNKKHDRSGALFEGKFKAKHVDGDEYLKYLFAYIHLNPVSLIQSDWKDSGIHNVDAAYEHARTFPYSSLRSYMHSSGNRSDILNLDKFPEYFANAAEKKDELMDWLRSKERTVV